MVFSLTICFCISSNFVCCFLKYLFNCCQHSLSFSIYVLIFNMLSLLLTSLLPLLKPPVEEIMYATNPMAFFLVFFLHLLYFGNSIRVWMAMACFHIHLHAWGQRHVPVNLPHWLPYFIISGIHSSNILF